MIKIRNQRNISFLNGFSEEIARYGSNVGNYIGSNVDQSAMRGVTAVKKCKEN